MNFIMQASFIVGLVLTILAVLGIVAIPMVITATLLLVPVIYYVAIIGIMILVFAHMNRTLNPKDD